MSLFFISILIITIQGISAESMTFCYGKELSIKFDVNVQPIISCLRIFSDWGDCSNGLTLRLYSECNETLIYIDGQGNKLEFGKNITGNPYYSYMPDFPDTHIPQEVGAEWIRQVYFKDNPGNITIISGKTLASVSEESTQNNSDISKENGIKWYYPVGISVLLLIVLIVWLINRKK